MLMACTVLKKTADEGGGGNIKGKYKIIKTEEVNNNGKSRIICYPYDRQTNTLVDIATVQIIELKLEAILYDGISDFEVPPGRYKITVNSFGYTDIQTRFIHFKPNTKTEIRIELGTYWIH